jgi:hypothetical protein
MRAMADAPDSRKRLLVRATLVAGMLLAALGLWAVVAKRCEGPPAEEPALPADTGRHVRVRGSDGSPAPGAAAFLMQRSSDGPQDVTWHESVGVLVLPENGKDYPVRVIAPGYRVQDLPAVRGGQIITLVPGLLAQVSLRGVPSDGLPEHVRFLLRVKPAAVDVEGLQPQEIVDLMDNRGGPGSGPEHIPRGDFGYPVSREQARAGIVLPAPGSYHVHWGLIDTKARTWVRARGQEGRKLAIKDDAAAQPFFLDVTLEQLQQAIDELETGVSAVRKQKK